MLLLNERIPLSSVDAATTAVDLEEGSLHYPTFRKAVFKGASFTQWFEDIHIRQYGIVADVEVVGRGGINTALERLRKNDVRFRFIIDMMTDWLASAVVV